MTWRPLTQGRNNSTVLVEAGAERYVLRLYRNHANAAWVRYELGLVRDLDEQELPFDVSELINMRRIANLVHITGRYRDGLSGANEVRQALSIFAAVSRWLERDLERLQKLASLPKM